MIALVRKCLKSLVVYIYIYIYICVYIYIYVYGYFCLVSRRPKNVGCVVAILGPFPEKVAGVRGGKQPPPQQFDFMILWRRLGSGNQGNGKKKKQLRIEAGRLLML